VTDSDGGAPDAKVLPFANPQQKRKGSPPPGSPKPPPGAGKDTEGLAAGYWREDGSVWTATGPKRNPRPIRLCSDMRAVHTESGVDGRRWALNVDVVDQRGAHKLVCFTRAEAETKPAECMSALVDAGLVVYSDLEKRSRLILNAVVRAIVPLAFGIEKTGLTKVGDRCVFALPSGVIEADGKADGASIVVWRGSTQYGRVRQGGKRDGWISEVAAPAEQAPLAMTAIGTMLSGPALPYLPGESESNTMLHYVGESGSGKTTIVRVGASVHGKGSQTTDPDSFLESYKNTINAVENILLAHNHLGICFDELKNIEQKAASTFAYDFGSGRRKGRMNADNSSRPSDSWALPSLSSGEITLADRANEQGFRHQTMDSGADVRVVNIQSDGAFDAVGNFAERKAYAEALGAASATHFGFAGPEFIRFLLNNEGMARDSIKKNLAVWGAITAVLLGSAPSLQSSRVATRLGSLVAPAALAAEVLALPWGADLSKFGVSASPAASAVFMAFSRTLDTWVGTHGVMYSTQTAEIFQRLRAYYHGAPKGAFIPCGLRSNDGIFDGEAEDEPQLPQAQTVPIRGWKVMANMKPIANLLGGPSELTGGELLYVDFIPAVLERDLGQSKRALQQALASLRDRKFLITEKSDALRTQRKVDGKNTTVIRVKGDFFAGQ
jgi:putative DNA primase/helicase